MIKLSVIIPVFNTEGFVGGCIDSCINQNLLISEYEIILVNDGSTDGSLAICEEYTKKSENILLISQENRGLSSARNVGFSLAKGEYAWFVDSDDWIKPDSIKKMVETCDQLNLDILGFAAADVENGHVEKRLDYSVLENKVMEGRDFLLKEFSPCIPLYLFRTSFLRNQNIHFFEGIFHEDEELILRALYLSEKIGFLNDILYFVTVRSGSITRSVNPKRAFDLLKVSRSLAIFSETNVEQKYKVAFYDRISLCLNNALFNIFQMDRPFKDKLAEEFYVNRDLFGFLKKSSKLKYRFEGILFSTFPKYTLSIYRLMKLFG